MTIQLDASVVALRIIEAVTDSPIPKDVDATAVIAALEERDPDKIGRLKRAAQAAIDYFTKQTKVAFGSDAWEVKDRSHRLH